MTQPLTALLDLASGHLEQAAVRHRRRLSDLRGYFGDPEAEQRLIAAGDPLLYTYSEVAIPEEHGHLWCGPTTIQPGRVGDEYFMTRGHFHARADASEVYLMLRGEGRLLVQRRGGSGEGLGPRLGADAVTPPRFAPPPAER